MNWKFVLWTFVILACVFGSMFLLLAAIFVLPGAYPHDFACLIEDWKELFDD